MSLRTELVDGARVVVIGAGFIGLEVAATATGRGCDVTVLEGLPAPLVRALGATMGTAVAARARAQRRRRALRACRSPASRWPTAACAPWPSPTAARCPPTSCVVGIGVDPAGRLAGRQRCRAARRHRLRRGAVDRVPERVRRGDCARWPNLQFGCTTRRCASSTGRTPPSRAPPRRTTCSRRPPASRPMPYAPGAVLLERPVRQPHPVPRSGRRRRRRAGRGGRRRSRRPVRRAVRPRAAGSAASSA